MEGPPRRAPRCLLLSVAVLLLVVLTAAPARADLTIFSSPGPLNEIDVGEELDCQALHEDYVNPVFWRPDPSSRGACGTWLRVAGRTFGPPIPGASPPITPRPYTLESQVGFGTGTPDDPFVIFTLVSAGNTNVGILQRDSYVHGDEAWRTAVTVINDNPFTIGVSVYRFGDCFLADDDGGFGHIDLSRRTVGCVGTNGASPTNDLLQWVPLFGTTPNVVEGVPSSILSDYVDTGQDFPNTCDHCPPDDGPDTGAGLSWTGLVDGNSAETVGEAVNVTSAGREVLFADLAAEPKALPTGGRTRISLTLTNPVDQDVGIDEVVVQLPPGASYVPGSSSVGFEPSVSGRRLHWGSATFTTSGELGLQFDMVPSQAGLQVINAWAQSSVHTIVDRQAGDVILAIAPDEPAPQEPPPPEVPPADTTPPETTLTGSPGQTTTDTTPTFTFASSEPGSSFGCRIDGVGGFTPCSSPHTTPVQQLGGHSFEVRAIDAAGNIDPTPAATTYRTIAGDDDPLPPPVPFESMNVARVEGQVLIGVPTGGRGARAAQAGGDLKGVRFVPLTADRQVPIGSFLDTSDGEVELTTARTAAGRTQTGQFFGGVFQVLQQRSSRPVTEVRLKGSSFARCRRGRGSATAAQSRRRVRRLWGNGRGRFRTRGRYAAATVRGTRWLVEDRCDGTLTRVTRGSVVVRDLRRRRNITVRAGRSYLARARARRR